MKNADKIGNVAKQMIGVCNVIINLSEADENEVYDEMLWDELSHTQKLVLEFTRYAFEEEEEVSEEVEEEVPVNGNYDEAFFAGELQGKLGDKTEDKGIVVEIEDDEESEAIDK